MERNFPNGPRGRRIAIIEDNPADAEMLHFALRQASAEIETDVLGDGLQALNYLGAADGWIRFPECNLVLLDLNLPVISGFEVLEQIRAIDKLKALPVIVVSGSSNQEDIDRSYRAGANSYICKAPQLEDILAIASRLVAYWFDCVRLPDSARNPGRLQ